jgi:hypothetical protein
VFNEAASPLMSAFWGVSCMLDLYAFCGSSEEPQDPLNIPNVRAQYPAFSLLSNSAGLIDSLQVGTLFFSGIRHVATTVLSVMGISNNIEKITLLEKRASLEKNLTLDGRSPSSRRMFSPYMGIIFSISMLAFSILGICGVLGYALAGTMMMGFGLVAAIAFGGEIALKKLPLSRPAFGSHLLLV